METCPTVRKMSIEEKNAELLFALQRGLPLEPRPFAGIGKQLGLTEDTVIEQIRRLFDGGKARRIGAVFDARRLGYKIALCSVKLEKADLDKIVPEIIPFSGITHCYLRGWPDELDSGLPGGPKGRQAPNLWFTYAALADRFDEELDLIRRKFEPHSLLVLPACRRFKIDVIFDTGSRKRLEKFPGSAKTGGIKPTTEEPFPEISGREKEVVIRLQGNLPPVPDLYKTPAQETGYDVAELLELLKRWKESGILRRIALIVHHQRIGFKANAMCVWPVADDIEEKGRKLAHYPEVTHCYERLSLPAFPYNLYAMIYGRNWLDTQALFERISGETGLPAGRLLFSLHEYKKTSMRYFE